MTDKQLKRLIAKGESQVLDFKQRVSSLTKIAKTITSFANTRGGQLLIGVTDHQQILGIDPAEETFLLEEASSYYCDPPITLSFERIEVERKIVLLVNIPNSPEKPHKAMNSKGEWIAYVRMNDKSVIASKMTVKLAAEESHQAKEHHKIKRKIEPQEASLIVYLQDHEKITLKQFAKLVNYSERRAKRKLIELTKMGVLLMHDFEKENFFTLR